jgi:hypothetical protein
MQEILVDRGKLVLEDEVEELDGFLIGPRRSYSAA